MNENIYCDWCMKPVKLNKKGTQFIVSCTYKCGFVVKLNEKEYEEYVSSHQL